MKEKRAIRTTETISIDIYLILKDVLKDLSKNEFENIMSIIDRSPEELPREIYDYSLDNTSIKKYVYSIQDLFTFSEYNFSREDKISISKLYRELHKDIFSKKLQTAVLKEYSDNDIFTLVWKSIFEMSKVYGGNYVVSVSRSKINECWKDKPDCWFFTKINNDNCKKFIVDNIYKERISSGEMTIASAALSFIYADSNLFRDDSGIEITTSKENIVIDTDLLHDNDYFSGLLDEYVGYEDLDEDECKNSSFIRLCDELIAITKALDINVFIYSNKELIDALIPNFDIDVIKKDLSVLIKDGSISKIASQLGRSYDEIVVECIIEIIRKKISRYVAAQLKILISKKRSGIISTNKEIYRISKANKEANKKILYESTYEDYPLNSDYDYDDDLGNDFDLADYYGYSPGSGQSREDFLDNL